MNGPRLRKFCLALVGRPTVEAKFSVDDPVGASSPRLAVSVPVKASMDRCRACDVGVSLHG